MLNVTVENIGELAVVECEGRIVQREATIKLRKAVTSQTDARIVVLELSEVHAIEGGGLGMLVFLDDGREIITSGSCCLTPQSRSATD